MLHVKWHALLLPPMIRTHPSLSPCQDGACLHTASCPWWVRWHVTLLQQARLRLLTMSVVLLAYLPPHPPPPHPGSWPPLTPSALLVSKHILAHGLASCTHRVAPHPHQTPVCGPPLPLPPPPYTHTRTRAGSSKPEPLKPTTENLQEINPP